jgi:hypothetical protein
MSAETMRGEGGSPRLAAPGRQEEDRISGRGAAVVTVALIAVIVALIVASWAVLRPRMNHAPPRAAAAEVSGVEQTLIGTDTSAYAIAARKRRILESYGWVSRPAGIARIPIEEAMKLVAAGHR